MECLSVLNRSQFVTSSFLSDFDKLNIKDTKLLVDQYVQSIVVEKEKDFFLKEEKDLGVLEGAD